MTTLVSPRSLTLPDFDVHVLVKNANVKNNIFSVIFTENAVCSAESLRKQEHLK